MHVSQGDGTRLNSEFCGVFLSHLGESMRSNPFTFIVITGVFLLVLITLGYSIFLIIYYFLLLL